MSPATPTTPPTASPGPVLPRLIAHGQFKDRGRFTKPCYQVQCVGSNHWFTSRAKAEKFLAGCR